MKKESSRVVATVMKTHNSGARAGATFSNRRAPEPELCHFYNSSAPCSCQSIFSK